LASWYQIPSFLGIYRSPKLTSAAVHRSDLGVHAYRRLALPAPATTQFRAA